MRPFRFFIALTTFSLTSVFSISANANDSIFFDIDSFNYSQPIAIKALTDDWKGDFTPGETALSLSQIELGFKRNNWQLSLLHRQDYLLDFSKDTSEFYYAIRNKLPLDENREYQLQLNSQSFSASGLKVAFADQWQNLNWQVGMSYLQGNKLTDGTLEGVATRINDDDYNFSFDVDYYYDRDVLFDRHVEQAPDGYGYAIDLSLSSQLNEKWALHLFAKDLLAQIFWQDAPRSVVTGNSATKTYDEDGYVVFNPVASGNESNQDFVQRIPVKLNLSATYQLTKQQNFKLGYRNLEIAEFYQANYQYETNRARYGIGYNLNPQDKTRSWSLRYQRDWIKIQLLSGTFNWQKAKTLGVNIGLSYRF